MHNYKDKKILDSTISAINKRKLILIFGIFSKNRGHYE